jgi:hypothetical protein
MICNRGVKAGGVGTQDVFGSTTLPSRMAGDVKPEAPVKPDERPIAPPPQEDPHYPTHTPPTPGTTPSQPCPSTDDPDEEFPAC